MAKKTTKHFRGVGYLLSTDPAELTSSSEYCVGKVSSNFIGTEFTLYAGRPICSHVPMEKGALTALPQDNRFQEELTSVLYVTVTYFYDKTNIGSQVQRKASDLFRVKA